MSQQGSVCRSWEGAFMATSLLVLAGCFQEDLVISGLKPETPPAWSTGCAPVMLLQPSLRWQAFAPKEAEGSEPAISGVTYEVRVWEAFHEAPGKLVYVREGLLEPSHTLQEPLKVATNYFWSVRARFMLGGKPRVTDWGLQRYMKIRIEQPQPMWRSRVLDHEYYQYFCFQTTPESK